MIRLGKFHTKELHARSRVHLSLVVCTVLLAHLIDGSLLLCAWTTITTGADM